MASSNSIDTMVHGNSMKHSVVVCISCGKEWPRKRMRHVNWKNYTASSKTVQSLKHYIQSIRGVSIMICDKCHKNLANVMTCDSCGELVHKYEDMQCADADQRCSCKYWCNTCKQEVGKVQNCARCEKSCRKVQM